jgi:hypothetical protein
MELLRCMWQSCRSYLKIFIDQKTDCDIITTETIDWRPEQEWRLFLTKRLTNTPMAYYNKTVFLLGILSLGQLSDFDLNL